MRVMGGWGTGCLDVDSSCDVVVLMVAANSAERDAVKGFKWVIYQGYHEPIATSSPTGASGYASKLLG